MAIKFSHRHTLSSGVDKFFLTCPCQKFNKTVEESVIRKSREAL